MKKFLVFFCTAVVTFVLVMSTGPSYGLLLGEDLRIEWFYPNKTSISWWQDITILEPEIEV